MRLDERHNYLTSAALGSLADRLAVQGQRPTPRPGSSTPSHLAQLQPLVLPQPSQTKHDPAGRILVPQVKHSGASTEAPIVSISSADVCAESGAGFATAAPAPDSDTAAESADSPDSADFDGDSRSDSASETDARSTSS